MLPLSLFGDPSMAIASTTTQLESHQNELVKQKIVLDGQNRPWKVYTAMTYGGNNALCQVTEYVYASPTSTVIIGRKEGNALWDSTWDTMFTVTE